MSFLGACRHELCCHIRLDTLFRGGSLTATRRACPSQLGEVFCGLAIWAHEHGLRGGQVAKAAQVNYTMSAALELAPHGITANMVHLPGRE